MIAGLIPIILCRHKQPIHFAHKLYITPQPKSFGPATSPVATVATTMIRQLNWIRVCLWTSLTPDYLNNGKRHKNIDGQNFILVNFQRGRLTIQYQNGREKNDCYRRWQLMW
ncbi:hypothetical protein PoB_006438300 [Plakobranchus ocellatus]|uniref:Uncharacterized protein n=1 Tax=Plakobranchus ocellatus TaxID=259542 RepID=A0AAV4D177_9GAST|nr:hypothetical protein PoB_006438300 [Plakobranchus ocellatus]